MARYDFRCEHGHVTELVQSMADAVPPQVECAHLFEQDGSSYVDPTIPLHPNGRAYYENRGGRAVLLGVTCGHPAARVWTVPAAIHMHGKINGLTQTRNRRRRKNAGETLPRGHQADSAAIARSL